MAISNPRVCTGNSTSCAYQGRVIKRNIVIIQFLLLLPGHPHGLMPAL